MQVKHFEKFYRLLFMIFLKFAKLYFISSNNSVKINTILYDVLYFHQHVGFHVLLAKIQIKLCKLRKK